MILAIKICNEALVERDKGRKEERRVETSRERVGVEWGLQNGMTANGVYVMTGLER